MIQIQSLKNVCLPRQFFCNEIPSIEDHLFNFLQNLIFHGNANSKILIHNHHMQLYRAGLHHDCNTTVMSALLRAKVFHLLGSLERVRQEKALLTLRLHIHLGAKVFTPLW